LGERTRDVRNRKKYEGEWGGGGVPFICEKGGKPQFTPYFSTFTRKGYPDFDDTGQGLGS